MESVASCTGFISSRTQRLVRGFFMWLGKNLYRHNLLFLALGLSLTAFVTAGGIMYYIFNCDANNGGTVQCDENRSFYLWVPQKAMVWSQFQEIMEVFGSYPSKLSILILTPDANENSIMLPSNLDIAYSIFDTIDNITYEQDGNTYYFSDLCLKSSPINPYCDSRVNNFFGAVFGENEMLWNNESTIEQYINHPLVPADFFLGKIEYDPDDNTITGARALRFLYELRGSTDKTQQDIVYEYMGKWQDFWKENQAKYTEEDNIDMVFYSDRSFDDEISRVVSGDLPIFGMALMTMMVYLMFTLGKMSCIGARPWLAFSAIWVMLCALCMGFSISICLGTTFNSIVMLVPYILLGVGVDDMIILVDTYDKTPMPNDDASNAHIRLGKALASSGLSISLTSFCSSMAFFVGSATDIPSISSFCHYAAWCFLTNYILQFLLFVPLMVIDDKRIRNKKNFCCPCCISHDQKLQKCRTESNGGTNSKDKVRKTSDDSKCIDKCNVEYLLRVTLFPILTKRICRITVIVLFMAVSVCSGYAIQFLDTTSDATKLVPDDSFVLDYLEEGEAIYGGAEAVELQIIIKNQDFSDREVRENILNMTKEMESQPNALDLTENWLEAFDDWLVAKNLNINGLECDEFYHQLKLYSNISSEWHTEINYDDYDKPTIVESTRFALRVNTAGSDTDQWPEYLEWNEIMDKYLPLDEDGYAYVPEYNFAYLATHIVQFTVFSMIFAGIGVFGVLVLLLDLRMSIFIMVIVTMIDLDLFGWMWLFDISLDALSFTQCVMAVGLTVDYVIHIAHAISDADPDNHSSHDFESYDKLYNAKLKIAFSEMGASVTKGAWTTFLGTLALIFSQSQAFRIFFYMFSGIISIAIAHGLILTPALMGEMRFIYAGIDHENEENQSNTDKKKKEHPTSKNLTLAQAVGDSNVSDHRTDDAANMTPSTGSASDLNTISAEKTTSVNDLDGTQGNVDNGGNLQMTNYSNGDDGQFYED